VTPSILISLKGSTLGLDSLFTAHISLISTHPTRPFPSGGEEESKGANQSFAGSRPGHYARKVLGEIILLKHPDLAFFSFSFFFEQIIDL